MNEIMTGKEIVDDILEHHGILGMKWGVRRYQNKDGSLTPAGKKRYDDDPDNGTKVETDAEKKARLLTSTDAKEIYENRHLLSTNELNERLNRIDTEARLASKIPTEKTKTGNDRMRDAKQTIDNVTNLYRSVDSAYSTVANSAIGKTLAKKLGLDVPKKEFNLEEIWENRNKLSVKDLSEASQRVESMNKIEQRLDNEKKKREKEAEDIAKKEADALKDAQKQVDDYAKTGFKDDKVTSPKEEKPTDYQTKGKDIVDSVLVTNKHLPAVIDVDMVENGQSHVDALLKSLNKQMKHSDLEEYLAHFGIKGMKWGVRRYQNKDGSLTAAGKKRVSNAQKDASKLADKAKTYYESVNKQNALYDTTGHMDKQLHKIVDDGYKLVTKAKTKLDRKYSDVVVKPEFEKNGYVVKAVETSVTKLDRFGRVSSVSKSYTPVETYNRWRNENPDLTNKIAKLQKERANKLKTAKTTGDVERIEMEYEEKIDDI